MSPGGLPGRKLYRLGAPKWDASLGRSLARRKWHNPKKSSALPNDWSSAPMHNCSGCGCGFCAAVSCLCCVAAVHGFSHRACRPSDGAALELGPPRPWTYERPPLSPGCLGLVGLLASGFCPRQHVRTCNGTGSRIPKKAQHSQTIGAGHPCTIAVAMVVGVAVAVATV